MSLSSSGGRPLGPNYSVGSEEAAVFGATCVGTIATWAIETFAHVPVPATVGEATVGLVTLGLVWVAGFHKG